MKNRTIAAFLMVLILAVSAFIGGCGAPRAAQILSVQDTFSGRKYSLYLDNVSEYPSEGGFVPQAGNKYVKADFIYENNTGKKQVLAPYYFTCAADKFACSEGKVLKIDTLVEVASGFKAVYSVVYEVPVTADKIEISWHENPADGAIATFEVDARSIFGNVTPTSANNKLYRGETVSTNLWEISYIDSGYPSADEYYDNVPAGKETVCFEITFKNLASSKVALPVSGFDCYEGGRNGIRCDDLNSMNIGNLTPIGFVQPGATVRVRLGYIVSDSTSDIVLVFQEGSFSDSTVEFVY